jgi:hypothetical protein
MTASIWSPRYFGTYSHATATIAAATSPPTRCAVYGRINPVSRRISVIG